MAIMKYYNGDNEYGDNNKICTINLNEFRNACLALSPRHTLNKKIYFMNALIYNVWEWELVTIALLESH